MRRTEHTDKWLAELRSGDRTQALGSLCEVKSDGTVSYCCLGVGADVTGDLTARTDRELAPLPNCPDSMFYGCDGDAGDVAFEVEDDNRHYGMLPRRVQDKLGLTEDDMNALASMNDTHAYSFAQIADEIEHGIEHGQIRKPV